MFCISNLSKFGGSFFIRSKSHQLSKLTSKSNLITRNFWQQIKAESAVVFKNNHGMICTHLSLPKGSTSSEMPTPPSAIQGTIWVNAPEEKIIAIESVNSLSIEQTEEEYCTSFPQILQANLNNVVELQLESKDWFSGKLTAVQLDTEPQSKYSISFEDIQKSEFSSAMSLIADSISTLVTKQISSRNGLAVLSTDKGHIVLPIHKLTAIRMPLHPASEQSTEDRDQVLRTLLQKKTMNTHIQVNYKLKQKIEQDEIARVSYISKGIGWNPQYKLVLDSSSNTAQLSLSATIHNSAEDLFAEDLICSAKQPNFDPVNNQPIQEKRNNISVDDEVHYTFKNVSVSSKETVSIPVFNSIIPFTNVYRAEIPEQRVKTMDLPVWNAVKIQNTTKHPWTSGSVIVSHHNFFTAQSKLSHTLSEENAFIHIGETPDVRLFVKEEALPAEEVVLKNRKYRATSIRKTSTVSNGKNEAIHFALTHNFFGASKSHDGAAKLKVKATYDANSVSQISWEVSLQPSESRELSHIYTIYEPQA